MSMEANQVTWTLTDKHGNTKHAVLNQLEPLSMSEWQERIEQSVAAAVEAGSYDLDVQFGPLLKLKWHVTVKRVAEVTPF